MKRMTISADGKSAEDIIVGSISAKSAGLFEITMVVFDYVLDKVIYYGTEHSCRGLERTSSNLIALPL